MILVTPSLALPNGLEGFRSEVFRKLPDFDTRKIHPNRWQVKTAMGLVTRRGLFATFAGHARWRNNRERTPCRAIARLPQNSKKHDTWGGIIFGYTQMYVLKRVRVDLKWG